MGMAEAQARATQHTSTEAASASLKLPRALMIPSSDSLLRVRRPGEQKNPLCADSLAWRRRLPLLLCEVAVKGRYEFESRIGPPLH